MSIDPLHLRQYVIRPACEAIGLYSLAAEELLLGTACQESSCGRYLHQLGGGPALGIFQMEEATHNDIWANFLKFESKMKDRMQGLLAPQGTGVSQLIWNLTYAAAMCRAHYYRVKEPLPGAGNLSAQAAYWKAHYNTPAGKGTVQEYVKNWRRFVTPLEVAK